MLNIHTPFFLDVANWTGFFLSRLKALKVPTSFLTPVKDVPRPRVAYLNKVLW